MSFRIGIVQFESGRYEVEDNRARAGQRIREAADRGADLVVLPEDAMAGIGPDMTKHADADGAYREQFRELAAEYGVDLVPGSWQEKEDGRFYNTTYYIDRSGEVLARYRKTHLWISEKSYATPGEGAVVADGRLGVVGLAICWDLAFPELFRDMLRQGADVAICAACWALEDAGAGQQRERAAEQVFIDACCTARAFENEMAMVFCNAAGTWEGSRGPCTSAGHSQLAMPFLGPVARLDHNREAVLVAEVDRALLEEAERSYQIKQDLLGAEE
ncbi:MAG: carbon-nitrogen hydrolase family protein [bacterium]